MDEGVVLEVPGEEGATEPSRPDRRRPFLAVGAGAVVVALYVWDDVLLATPIVVTSGWLGPGLAFVLLTPVFFVVSTALAVAAVRAHERATRGRPGRLERSLRRQLDHRRGRLATELMRATGLISFVLASTLLGGTVTTWLIRCGGRRHGMIAVAATSSAINAVTFVGLYSGLVALVL